MSFQTCMTFFILQNRYLNQKQMLLYYIQLYNYASVVIIHIHRCDLYYDTKYKIGNTAECTDWAILTNCIAFIVLFVGA